ncbi:MAG TPA: hypothetical protein VHO48_12910, partial [Anaerolineaceae bacterium]|nr:hypothetical protein [Anaerolineaceae bacterium]
MRKSSSRRLLRPPWKKPIITTIGLIVIYFVLMLLNGGLAANQGQVGLDMLLCGAGLVFWLFFFAQFTLPLRDLPGRYSAFKRLFLYTL